MAQLNILYVIGTSELPFPPVKGIHLRAVNVGRQLKKYGNVTLMCIVNEISENSINLARLEFDRVVIVEKPPSVESKGVIGFLRHKFHSLYSVLLAEQLPEKDRIMFSSLCREHDVVWFHTLAAADCLGVRNITRSVMDIDDLTHIKMDLLSKIESNFKNRIIAKWLSFKFKKKEFNVLNRFSTVCVCSKYDKDYLGNSGRICVLPNGFVAPQSAPAWTPKRQKLLGFIGALGYGPNRDGIEWFSNQVWPLIIKEIPDAALCIVGKTPEDSNFLQKEGFYQLGYVDDPSNELSTWSAMIVPLRVGGGTRIKIIESFSRMCPVISTSVGAYGLEIIDGKNILLADDPKAFAQACIKLLKTPGAGRTLAEEGWSLFVEKYTWDKIGEIVGTVIQNCLEVSTENGNTRDNSFFRNGRL